MKIPPKKFFFGTLIVILAILAFQAFITEPNSLVVNNYPIPIKNWSSQFNGFKIVAIADLHAGSNFITEEKIRQVVNLANAQEADAIILLGDYLSPQFGDRKKLKMPLKTMAANLSGLKAKYGVFAVLGNHDNEFGHNEVKTEFEKLGYRVLENEAVSLEKNGEKIRLLGLSDVLRREEGSGYSDRAKLAIENLNSKEGKIIAFTHNPEMFPHVTGNFAFSEDLVLFIAGHTHGGQCRFPIIGAPIIPTSYGQKYASGYTTENGVDIFVSTGIGTSILPVRFNVPPEISVLNLEAK